MSHRPSALTRTLLLGCVGIIICAGALVTSYPARAGIGNPLKKAKEKVAQIAHPEEATDVDDDTVVFDDLVLELTDARLDRIVAAFKASEAAGAGRAAVVEKLNKATDEHGKLWEKHSEAIMDLQRKRGDLEVCYHDGYGEAQQRLTVEYAQKALTDPGIHEKFARAAQEHNAAAARGDSAAIEKLNAVLYSETLISHQDSVEIREKCGPMPPPTPPEVKFATLDKEIASQAEQLRSIDKKVAEAQAQDVQMNQEQFAMATERIQMYLAWKKSSQAKSTPVLRGFTQEEIDALEKHLEGLRAALG